MLYAIYRWRRHEFDGVLDGIVYAGMVGLGFAFTENVLYYGRTALEGGDVLAATFFVRGVMAPFAHSSVHVAHRTWPRPRGAA